MHDKSTLRKLHEGLAWPVISDNLCRSGESKLLENVQASASYGKERERGRQIKDHQSQQNYSWLDN